MNDFRFMEEFAGYIATGDGRIIGPSGVYLKPFIDPDGYQRVKVPFANKNGLHVFRRRGVHQLVCAAFNGQRPEGAMACHRDGDKANNAPTNLYWGTAQDNSDDRKVHGNAIGMRGEMNSMSRLTQAQITEMRALRLRGFKQRELAARFGTCRTNVSLIVNGKRWGYSCQAN